jgi:hypothetical protein
MDPKYKRHVIQNTLLNFFVYISLENIYDSNPERAAKFIGRHHWY